MTPDWPGMGFGAFGVSEVQHHAIPMKDGTRVALKLWLPSADLTAAPWAAYASHAARVYEPGQTAPSKPVTFGAVFEYLPYCKDYHTLERDHARHSWFASHGLVCVRADIRGTGASEGFYLDEYTQQELDDGVEIIAWIEAQPWSNGRVGMFGKSWAGFNGLQIAALQPPALKAVVSIYSTDDRYADDVHYMGGAVIGSAMVSWASKMFVFNARPPPPFYFANLEEWKAAWRRRMELGGESWLGTWLSHQRRTDAYWAHGSVSEDMSRVEVPVLAIGGLADGYTNAALRMGETLNAASRVIVGPWSHDWPDVACPGPRIDFLGECLRWWQAHLSTPEDAPNPEREAAAALPRVRLFMRDSQGPATILDTMPGRWVALPDWAEHSEEYRRAICSETPDQTHYVSTFFLDANKELTRDATKLADAVFPLEPHKYQGAENGEWLSLGEKNLPGDQRLANEHSLTFRSAPMTEELALSGFATAILNVRAETEGRYSLAVRLSEEQADGSATRLSFGLLNLAQWEGERRPAAAFPAARTLAVRVQLNVVGYVLRKGARLLLSVAPSAFPLLYPACSIHGLSLHTQGSRLTLQSLPPAAFEDPPIFAPPRPLLGLPMVHLVPAASASDMEDLEDGGVRFTMLTKWGDKETPHMKYTIGETDVDVYTLDSTLRKAHTLSTRECHTEFTDLGLKTSVLTTNEMTTEGDGDFQISDKLLVKVNEEVFYEKKWEKTVRREFV